MSLPGTGTQSRQISKAERCGTCFCRLESLDFKRTWFVDGTGNADAATSICVDDLEDSPTE